MILLRSVADRLPAGGVAGRSRMEVNHTAAMWLSRSCGRAAIDRDRSEDEDDHDDDHDADDHDDDHDDDDHDADDDR